MLKRKKARAEKAAAEKAEEVKAEEVKAVEKAEDGEGKEDGEMEEKAVDVEAKVEAKEEGVQKDETKGGSSEGETIKPLGKAVGNGKAHWRKRYYKKPKKEESQAKAPEAGAPGGG